MYFQFHFELHKHVKNQCVYEIHVFRKRDAIKDYSTNVSYAIANED